MVTVTPKHEALWAKANALTVPSKTEQPPTYGAWHRRPRKLEEREAEPVEAEGEEPELEAIGAE